MTSPAQRRRRGRATQDFVAAHLQPYYPFALAVGSALQGKDITGTPGIACEVKARKDFAPLAWMRQAQANAGPSEVAFVVLRPNGAGPVSIGSWPALLPFDALLELLVRAGVTPPAGTGGGNDGGDDENDQPSEI